MKNISPHITYKEATYSNKAKRLNVSNKPNEKELRAIKFTAKNIFEPVRNYFNVPIKVNSFFRNFIVNKLVGGSKSSQHQKGEAIDIDDTYGGVTNKEIFFYIKDNLEFDQLIWEFGDDENPLWVHASIKENGKNRGYVLKAIKVNNKSKYIKF